MQGEGQVRRTNLSLLVQAGCRLQKYTTQAHDEVLNVSGGSAELAEKHAGDIYRSRSRVDSLVAQCSFYEQMKLHGMSGKLKIACNVAKEAVVALAKIIVKEAEDALTTRMHCS